VVNLARLPVLPVVLASLYSVADLPATPVALWSFDSPNTASEGRSRATLEGAAKSGYLLNPLVGGSYQGDTGGYVQTLHQALPNNAAWSISVWLRSDSDIGATDTLASWRNPSNFSLNALRNDSGRIVLDSGTTSYTWRPENPMNGQWHHALLTTANGGAPYSLFVDGRRMPNPTTATITPSVQSNVYLRLGSSLDRGAGNARDWDGWLDDAAIFDRALSAEKAAAIHGAGRLGIGAEEFGVIELLLAAPIGETRMIAGKQWERVTSGLSGALGAGTGSIAGGNAAIVTTGGGAGLRMAGATATQASLSSTPASFERSTGFGHAATEILSLSNSSATAPVLWDLVGRPGGVPELDACGRGFDLGRESILAEIASRSLELPLIAGGSIQDEPYPSTGNTHTFKHPGTPIDHQLPLSPGQTRIVTHTQGTSTGTVRYMTRVAEGFVSFSADCTNVQELRVGGFFYSESLSPTSTTAIFNVHGTAWKAWLYRIASGRGPVVHHVFLTPNDPLITGTTAGTSTENFTLRNLPTSCRVHHLWFTREFTAFPDAAMTAVAKRFLEATHLPAPWFQPEAVTGTLAATGNEDVALTFDSAGLEPGTYTTSFAVVAAGTDAATVPTDAFKGVRFTVLAPEFTAQGPAARTQLLPGYEQRGHKITLTPAAGFTFGTVIAVSGAPWLRAIPSENRIGEVDLIFDTSGLAAGVYETTVTITAGNTVQIVPVSIEVVDPRYRQILADPFRSRVYLLHEGYDLDRSKILVLDAVSGSIVREIHAGSAYTMALSPDGGHLHTLNRPDNAIATIDLQRMTRGAAVPLADGIPGKTQSFDCLNAGLKGVLYFLNSNYTGKLFAVDSKTGQVIQQIDAPEGAATHFSELKLSADAKTLYATPFGSPSADVLGEPLLEYAIAADGKLTKVPSSERVVLQEMGDQDAALIQISPSGRLVAVGDQVFEPGEFLATSQEYPHTVRAISRDGEFVVTDRAILDPLASRKLVEMPVPDEAKEVAITPEGRVFYASSRSYGVVNPLAIDGAERAGFGLFPAEGSNGPAPDVLRWAPVDGAREYRIYLSKTAADLEPAVPGTAASLFKSRLLLLPTPVTMNAGETWYWRVDATVPTGHIRGQVHSFAVANFGVKERALRVDFLKGCRAQPLKPTVILPDGAAVESGVNRAWLKQSPGGDPLSFEIDSTLMPSDEESAVITFSSGGTTVEVPVSARSLTGDHRGLLADTAGENAYGLVFSRAVEVRGNQTGPYFVARLDLATGDILESRAVGFGARSLALSSDGEELGIDKPHESVEILKAADFSRQGTVWSFATSGSSGQPSVVMGTDDKLVTNRVRLNWRTGEILGRLGLVGSRPFNAMSPDETRLYGGTNNDIYMHDANSPALAQLVLLHRGNNSSERVMVSRDGSRVAFSNLLFDRDLTLVDEVDFRILRMNGRGDLIAADSGIYHCPSMRKITALPVETTDLGLCDAAATMIYYKQNSGGIPDYAVLPLGPLLALEGSALVPEIANGSLVLTDSVFLKWNDLAAASSYRVYFGTDASQVAAAGPGSPLELGVVTEARWGEAMALDDNATYYWKVVAEGPLSRASSAVWSFRTPDFSFDKPVMAIASPIAGPMMTAVNTIAAPAGRPWTISTTTPWIQLPVTGGSGSGSFEVRATPTATAGTRTGSIQVTVGSDVVQIPVSFFSFRYSVRDYVADPGLGVLHMLVAPHLATAGLDRLHLMRVDMQSLSPLETLDTALEHQGNGNTLAITKMAVHPQDHRLYIYHSTAGKVLGIERGAYRIASEFNAAQILGTAAPAAMVPAGSGRLAFGLSEGGIAIHEAGSGLRLHGTTGDTTRYPLMKVSPAADRLYVMNSSPVRPKFFELRPDEIVQGTIATSSAGSFGAELQISGDGNTISYNQGFYNRDLDLLGSIPNTPSPERIVSINQDGSQFLASSSSGVVRWAARSGVDPALPTFLMHPIPKIEWDSTRGRMFYRLSAGSGYRWLKTMAPGELSLPAMQFSDGWITSGPADWRETSPGSGVQRTPQLVQPATGDLSPVATLAFKSKLSGTLNFQWRNVTNGGEIFDLIVNGTSVDTRSATNSFVARSHIIPANATVEFSYYKPFGGATGTAPAGEIRNISLTFSGAITVPQEPTADSDGDGASDLLEVAMGSDAAVPGSLPVTVIDAGDEGGRTFRYERPAGLPYRYQVQISDDLVNWKDLATEEAVEPGDGGERVSIPIPAGRGKAFLRLHVTPVQP
jgi:hypothetical protein